MRTLNPINGKNNPVDVFNSLRGQSLTKMEMNFVLGGGDPTDPEPRPIPEIFPLP